MRSKIFIFVVMFISLSFTSIFAADFVTPHRFKPGDVISADVINEIFDYIESTKKTMLPEDLVGTWRCTKYRTNESYPAIYPPGYQLSNSGLFVSMKDLVLIITRDTDGSFKWNSPSRNAFTGIFVVTDLYQVPTGRYSDECPGNGIVDSVEGDFAVSSPNCLYDLGGWGPSTFLHKTKVSKISNTRIKFNCDGVQLGLLCDLQTYPPATPFDLVAEESGYSITLRWTHDSINTTGFKILRKNTLTGDYLEIATVSAVLRSYTDTLSNSGTYWYRVQATNPYGDSLGSNVVDVIVE